MYDPDFLPGVTIAHPALTPQVIQQAFQGGVPIDHTNFSVVFNQVRGLAVYAAHNIDGDHFLADGPDRHGFTLDPLVPSVLQIDNDRGYVNNPWDRGHLARRRALHWPDFATADQADRESSHWTNIAPQHHRLNQGPWSDVEDFLLDISDDPMNRACVFTGPVFTLYDPELVNRPGELPIQIPAGYWKVAAVRHQGQVCAAAFLLWQCDIHSCEPVPFDPVLEQVRINTIEYLVGLRFSDVLREADPLRFEGPNATCVVGGAGDIAL